MSNTLNLHDRLNPIGHLGQGFRTHQLNRYGHAILRLRARDNSTSYINGSKKQLLSLAAEMLMVGSREKCHKSKKASTVLLIIIQTSHSETREKR